MAGLVRRLARALPDYAANAWVGLVEPRLGRGGPMQVVQGVVLSEQGVLLAVRSNLRGWELPGGHGRRGEAPEVALAREIHEETGVDVEVGSLVGSYRRTGFRPHVALVYRCRPTGGAPRPSRETPLVRDARRRGLAVIDGFELLVAQALLQYRRMSGNEASADTMARAGRTWLSERRRLGA